MKKARGALFKLLGPAFSSKCLLSPAVQLHLFRIYVCPIARSGLSAWPWEIIILILYLHFTERFSEGFYTYLVDPLSLLLNWWTSYCRQTSQRCLFNLLQHLDQSSDKNILHCKIFTGTLSWKQPHLGEAYQKPVYHVQYRRSWKINQPSSSTKNRIL